jgi:hypothetical protein
MALAIALDITSAVAVDIALAIALEMADLITLSIPAFFFQWACSSQKQMIIS